VQPVSRAQKLGKAIPMLQSAARPLLTGKADDWHGEYAYSLGLQAFIYGFPYIYNARLRHQWVTQPRNPALVPYAAVNHFWHAGRLVDAAYRDGGCPNNDTLYSIAWLDLSEEPIVLSHPDMGSRYFAFELLGMGSDNFDYIGQRATGSDAAASRSSVPAGRVTSPPTWPPRSRRRRRRGCLSWVARQSMTTPTW
jgi:hypothetical protein